MTYVPDVRYHILVAEIPPGDYVYRFVVDGRWKVADGDPNLVEDQFGELSHFLSISHESLASATPKRFSTAAVAHAEEAIAGRAGVATLQGESDTESEDEGRQETERPETPPLPRKRGDANYVEDYDDDACGDLDLQADVFEAMKDVAESTDMRETVTSVHSQASSTPRRNNRGLFRRPGGNMLRRVWGMLFGDLRDENIDPEEETSNVPTRNQKKLGLVENENALKKGLKVWFPNEKNFPGKSAKGRKIDATETKEVIDVGDKALKLHQVEDNANTRQMLGKTLFAQGKYDAALALFSLSVKLREDNGLKYAKTTAIAHTDVASAFIHLDDLKNAEKHLKKALAIYAKGTFSGGKAQLGDVHCFLGVIGDMQGNLKGGELSYRNAIELYEKSKATDDNPNYRTAIENLNANLKRQKLAPQQQAASQLSPSGPVHSRDEPGSLAKQENGTPSATESSVSLKQQSQLAMRPPPPPRLVPTRRPLEASKPAPHMPVDEHDIHPRSILKSTNQTASTHNDPCYQDRGTPKQSIVQIEASKRKSRQPKSWKDLADNARASMPEKPPDEDLSIDSDDMEGQSVGAYEEMSRTWHKDARKLMVQGKYKEAIDLYTLAIYTRKRHGPWGTRPNAETLVENARALFATKELEESVKMLRDAIEILEKLDKRQHGLFLGEVWGNLGSVLDRMGQHSQEALMAHCAGMVTYGRAGMSTDDPKWLKAWKNLCLNLKLSEGSPNSKTTDEVWQSIDLQIRGVTPMTKVATVTLRK